MNQLIISLLFLMTFLTSFSQKNRTYVSLQYVEWESTQLIIDSFSNQSSKIFDILPILGFQREIKNDAGFGIEVGYQSSKPKNDAIQYNNSNKTTQQTNYTNKVQSFYFSPLLFKNYSIQSYLFQLNASLPLVYNSKTQYSSVRKTIDSNNNIIDEIRGLNESPKNLSVSILANISIQRQIVKGFYLGGQIGFGVSGNFGLSNGRQKTFQSSNSVVIQDEDVIVHYSKKISGELTFKPSLILSYRF